MKRYIALALFVILVLCSCSKNENAAASNTPVAKEQELLPDDRIVGMWLDVKTEGMIEFTADGYYYEYVNEVYTDDKTKYEASGGKLTRYLEGSRKDTEFTVPYEIKDGHLIISGEIEYKPIDIKTSLEEMEQE